MAKRRWKQYRKKYADLYNALWELVHADDKYVYAGEETHEQLAARLEKAIVAQSKKRGFVMRTLDGGEEIIPIYVPSEIVEIVLNELMVLPGE